MSCPAWEDCNKKSCIEESTCMNGDYWANYWKNVVAVSKAENKERKTKNRAVYFKDRLPCVKTGDSCDKKEACAILGQCIIEHPRIAGKNHFINALRGKLDVGAIVKILRLHDPLPFDSYYPKKKTVRK